jgi:protoporphyrinogen oxidase
MERPIFKAIIVGAGPAGLTAAYELSKQQAPVVVLESDPNMSAESRGPSTTRVPLRYRRPPLLLQVARSRRFLDRDRWRRHARSSPVVAHLLPRQFYTYPLKPFEALSKLGLIESTLCMLSFLAARLNPTRNPKTFEDWVSNQFGKRLFRIFFKTYTEKVWGMSCNEISADWAAQRIKGLSLGSAIKHALFSRSKPKDRKQIVKTLIDTFRYPRLGPGMMWEACAEKVRKLGGEVLLGRRVVGCRFDSATQSLGSDRANANGDLEEYRAEHLISSMPIRELVAQIEPRFPSLRSRRRARCAIAIS